MRRVYTVSSPDHEADITVIAPSEFDACTLAADYCDEIEKAADYTATESPERGLRWVGFESPSDAEWQVRDLDARGADPSRVYRRVTFLGKAEILWEVGCVDSEWCRLPSGVLCGGES